MINGWRAWNMATASPGSAPGAPRLGLNGYQASLGYVLSTSMADQRRLAAAGLCARPAALFFNGAPRLDMDAGFLHLQSLEHVQRQ